MASQCGLRSTSDPHAAVGKRPTTVGHPPLLTHRLSFTDGQKFAIHRRMCVCKHMCDTANSACLNSAARMYYSTGLRIESHPCILCAWEKVILMLIAFACVLAVVLGAGYCLVWWTPSPQGGGRPDQKKVCIPKLKFYCLQQVHHRKSPQREVVRCSAGSGVVYPPPLFGGRPRSIPQRMVSDV